MKRFFLGVLACAGILMSAAPSEAVTFPNKLYLSSDGLALSFVPGRRVLIRSVKVSLTQGKGPAAWTASSDQSWLTVTPSGTTGDALRVEANVWGLPRDQFYLANVTVSTNDGLTDTETLRVGLWVGSSAPGVITLPQKAFAIATNPVTPIAYVTDGVSKSILEFNVYTGALVGTLDRVAPTLGYMEVSSDGRTLFAADTTNNKIVALDADSGALIAKYNVGYGIKYGFDMVYARPFGQPALYIAGSSPEDEGGGGYGRIIAYPSGARLADGIHLNYLAVTPDGQTVFSLLTDISPGTISGYNVRRRGDVLSLKSIGSTMIEGGGCLDLAISHDGKQVYPACGSPYGFDVYSGKTLSKIQTLPADDAYPDNIEIDSNDHVVGGLDGEYQQDDVYVCDQKGFPLGQVANPEGSSQPVAMKVSGDATRVISSTNVNLSPQALIFRNMP
jgi:sugar lactone lactonase YvrE